MWNSRVTLTVLVSLIGLVLLCVLLGGAYAPYYSSRRGARLTQIAAGLLTQTAAAAQAVGATQVAFLPTQTALAGATQTEAARPTVTTTPTATPTNTSTPTATPPAAIVACPATVAGTHQFLYPVPGGGRVHAALPVPSGSAVSIIGRLRDQGWVQVETQDGANGWMRGDAVAPSQPGCQANIYELSYVLGMVSGRQVLADDTFVSNENGWTNAAGRPICA
jgi:hypothetical protein